MGRSESSILARKSGISGVGYLCDIVGGLSICLSRSHARSYVPQSTNDSKPPVTWENTVTLADPMGILSHRRELSGET